LISVISFVYQGSEHLGQWLCPNIKNISIIIFGAIRFLVVTS